MSWADGKSTARFGNHNIPFFWGGMLLLFNPVITFYFCHFLHYTCSPLQASICTGVLEATKAPYSQIWGQHAVHTIMVYCVHENTFNHSKYFLCYALNWTTVNYEMHRLLGWLRSVMTIKGRRIFVCRIFMSLVTQIQQNPLMKKSCRAQR